MRAGVLLFVFGLAGCQTILGLDEPRLVDAGIDTQRAPDAPLDAALVQGCPSAFVSLDNGGASDQSARYGMLPTSMSFLDAEHACAMLPTSADRHTHLAVFATDSELTAVNQAFSSTAGDSRWIGLSTTVNGKPTWVTDELITSYPPASGTPWALGEPDGGTEQCVAMKVTASLSGALEDLACTTMLPAICECDGYADDPTHY